MKSGGFSRKKRGAPATVNPRLVERAQKGNRLAAATAGLEQLTQLVSDSVHDDLVVRVERDVAQRRRERAAGHPEVARREPAAAPHVGQQLPLGPGGAHRGPARKHEPHETPSPHLSCGMFFFRPPARLTSLRNAYAPEVAGQHGAAARLACARGRRFMQQFCGAAVPLRPSA